MPELPDVEAFRQYLYSTSLHSTVAHVEARDDLVLEDISQEDLRETLVGTELADTARHGKWLLAQTAYGPWLCFHFGMTGELAYFGEATDIPEHTRVLFVFENGMHLAYLCQRRLGRITLTESVEELVRRKELGPDARDISWECFSEVFSGRTAPVKPLLMDQKVIAGLGNILVDEILFRSRLHPERSVHTLGEEQRRDLHDTLGRIVAVLIRARTQGDEVPDNWLLHYRSEGEQCPRCGAQLKRMSINSRATYLCPRCQSQR